MIELGIFLMGLAVLLLLASNYYLNKRMNLEQKILDIYTDSIMSEQRSIKYMCEEMLKILEKSP